MAVAAMLKDKGQLMFEDKWPSMRPIILKLLQQEPVTQNEWQDLFYSVHLVCLWDEKGPPKVKEALKDDIMDFIKQAQQRVLSHQEDQALLKAYIAEWRKFFTQCNYLPTPFRQLETSLAGKTSSSVQKKAQNDESIVRKLMLDSWNQSIFCDIKQRLQDSAMKLVHAERNGEAFDSLLVIGVRESYVNLCSNPEDKLQIYRENFEKAYIEATEAFYKMKAPQYLQANGVQNYMKYADSKLREEEQRAHKYLESCSGSVQVLTDCCVNVLVSTFKSTILAECAGMIKANETERLQLMFKLMDRVPDGIQPMLHDLEEHIMSAGLADMVAAADVITQDSEKYVERLLELFKQFSVLVSKAFNDDPRFLTARDKAYRHVVNDTQVFRLELPAKQTGGLKAQPESKCPELLANYCDMLLRKTPLSKKLTSDEIESKLKDVLLVLKYVQNKDVFMRYHKAHLTRRLILDTSADSEKEENMVEWLREVGMPADYVNKLARMFQDIKVSEDLNQQFKETYRSSRGSIAVLFAWNQRPLERIPYENLRLATELPDPELRRTLWSLVAFPKLKRQVLQYSPEVQSPKDFEENTMFWVNQEFALVKNGKLQRRGKINLVGRLQLSTERSKEEDNESIVQLRILRVQSELVDILKNMFLPSKKMIKEQVEWLIEHKYMRRDEDDINTFIYMA
ncbi:Cullin homolog 1 [Gryllus bimaculatus]|nr:Cullin homolog 1 [Gryllus bimaculatus]